jgi:colicin import membrane protein
MPEQIVPVEAEQVIKETEIMVKSYDNYIVANQKNYNDAGESLKVIKSKYKEVDDLRKSLTKPLDDSKKRIMELFGKPLDFLEKAEQAVKSAMLKWQQEQERIRKAEEERLQAEQRRQAAELERQAKEAEERAAKLKTSEAREKAEAKAAELKSQAAVVASVNPVVESAFVAVKGVATRTVWKFKIVDVNKIPREFMIPDEKLIGKMAEVTKGTKKIDGVEFYSEEIIAARRS